MINTVYILYHILSKISIAKRIFCVDFSEKSKEKREGRAEGLILRQKGGAFLQFVFFRELAERAHFSLFERKVPKEANKRAA